MKERTKLLIIFALLALASAMFDEASMAIAVVKPIEKKTAVSTKNIKTLEEALKAGLPVVVKLGSDRCYPCRMMNPTMKELAVEQDGKAVFLNLDVYENRDLAKQVGVMVIPTILFFDKHGKQKGKTEGGMSKEDLLKTIKKLELNSSPTKLFQIHGRGLNVQKYLVGG